MAKAFRRSLAMTLGALATTALGGCYYGDVYGSSYASGGDCAARYGADYYDYDGYAYDDGYGYDCYDASDYGGGFAQIGFGGGWYDNYYYPGYGTYLYDRSGQYWMMNQYYRNYWGGWRNDWRNHHGNGHDRDRNSGGFNPGRIARDAEAIRNAQAPRQGDAPRMHARPEQINRNNAQVVRDGRGTYNRDNAGRGYGNNRSYQRPNATPNNNVTQPRRPEDRRSTYKPSSVKREQPVTPPQMRERGNGRGGFGSDVADRARAQSERQAAQQRAMQQRAVQQQQRQQATPAPQRPERVAPATRQAPPRQAAPRSSPRNEGRSRVQEQ